MAQAQGFTPGEKLHIISLGQGQGSLAQAVIELAAKQGASACHAMPLPVEIIETQNFLRCCLCSQGLLGQAVIGRAAKQRIAQHLNDASDSSALWCTIAKHFNEGNQTGS